MDASKGTFGNEDAFPETYKDFLDDCGRYLGENWLHDDCPLTPHIVEVQEQRDELLVALQNIIDVANISSNQKLLNAALEAIKRATKTA